MANFSPQENFMNQNKSGLSAEVYQNILQLILCRELPGGALIKERQLALKLNVSRTPVREAINQLEAQGLLSRSAGQLQVANIGVNEFMEILNVRALLEIESVRLACGRIDSELIQRWRNLIAELSAAHSNTAEQHWNVDDAIHNGIAISSGNTLLAQMLLNLRMRTRMFDHSQLPKRLQPGCTEHLAILDAIEANQPEQAARAMQLHINAAKQSILNYLQGI